MRPFPTVFSVAYNLSPKFPTGRRRGMGDSERVAVCRTAIAGVQKEAPKRRRSGHWEWRSLSRRSILPALVDAASVWVVPHWPTCALRRQVPLRSVPQVVTLRGDRTASERTVGKPEGTLLAILSELLRLAKAVSEFSCLVAQRLPIPAASRASRLLVHLPAARECVLRGGAGCGSAGLGRPTAQPSL